MAYSLEDLARYQKKRVEKLTLFIDIIDDALDEYERKRFKSLFTACAKYGTPGNSLEEQFEECFEAWRRDTISEETWCRIDALWKEYERFDIGGIADEIIDILNSRRREAVHRLQDIEKEILFKEGH